MFVKFNFHDKPNPNNLLEEIHNKKTNIMTTSQDFVRIKNGMEIASPMKFNVTPNVRSMCKITK